MSGWAGFWIGCGIAVLGMGIGDVGDAIREVGRLFVRAYEDSFDDNNEVPEDVQ